MGRYPTSRSFSMCALLGAGLLMTSSSALGAGGSTTGGSLELENESATSNDSAPLPVSMADSVFGTTSPTTEETPEYTVESFDTVSLAPQPEPVATESQLVVSSEPALADSPVPPPTEETITSSDSAAEPTSVSVPPPARYCRCMTGPDCVANIVHHNVAMAVPILPANRHNVVPVFNLQDYENEGLEESDAQSDCESLARAIEISGGRLRPPAVSGYRYTGNYHRIDSPNAPPAAQQPTYYRDATGWYRLSVAVGIPPLISCPLTECLWTGAAI